MSVFLPLLLTHFLADYPLQWGALIRLKQKRYLGVFLHCLIHLGVMLAVLQGFLHDARMFWGILVVFVTHNAIDQLKVILEKRHPKWRLPLYLLDQAAHVIIVTGVALWLGPLTPLGPLAAVYANPWVLSYLLVLVLSTYFYDVTHYFLKHRQPDGSHYGRNYPGILKRAALVTILFGILFWLE